MGLKTLTQLQSLILSLLEDGGERYGLELIAASDGYLKRGTIYVLLGRLQGDKFVKSKLVKPKEGEQGPSRRVYHITGSGARALGQWRDAQRRMSGILGLEGA